GRITAITAQGQSTPVLKYEYNADTGNLYRVYKLIDPVLARIGRTTLTAARMPTSPPTSLRWMTHVESRWRAANITMVRSMRAKRRIVESSSRLPMPKGAKRRSLTQLRDLRT